MLGALSSLGGPEQAPLFGMARGQRRIRRLEGMWELLSLQSAFYASLWVVVEGWREVPLSDPSVDEMLTANPRYLDILKRYRNSVFHYQPTHDAIHSRQIGLLAEGEVVGLWLCLLHDEFCRVYWEKLPRAAPHADERYAQREEELVAEIRQRMLALVGWIHTDIPGARAEKLREMSHSAMARLREAGDFESDEAVRLLKLVRQTPDWITEAEFEYQRLKREVIEQVKASALEDQASADRTESGALQAPPGAPKVQ